MPTLTREGVLSLNPRHPKPEVAAAKLTAAALRWGISTRVQLAMFVAQLAHESFLLPQEENLNYSAQRLMQVWPGRFPTYAVASRYARNPKALGNRVYDGRMGNGAGEGYLYRGRGLIMLTGKDNYRRYSAMTGFDLVKDPSLLLQYGVSAEVAGAFWKDNNLSPLAQRGDVRAVTRGINGGYIGLSDRERLYQRSLNTAVLAAFAPGSEEPPPLDPEADLEGVIARREEVFTQALDLVSE